MASMSCDHTVGLWEPCACSGCRAVIHPSYQDQQSGVSFEENEKRFKAAKEAGEVSRMVTWSGTSVGLIKEALPSPHLGT
ncbi:hypothetical protein TruAng_009536 [Truncatella angustata]|nr:hypothetical protein TruAng_009536 [Truncatella angustata]